MIYLLAPFNLSINTTSRNRILSFYHSLEKQGMDVTLINPPLIIRDREVYLNGRIEVQTNDLGNVINIPLKESVEERIVSVLVKKPSYKVVSAIFNLVYLTTAGRDFNYPLHSLDEYFKNVKLGSQDIIIASSPPATLFIAARDIAERYSCKLILDYRDPWTYGYKPIDSMPFINDFKKYRSRKHENKCLDYARLINCDSESVKQLFPKKYHKKISPISNGANLQVISTDKIRSKYKQFRIVYLGTIYNDQLVDNSFFSVLRSFIAKHVLNKDQLQLIFVGSAKNKRLYDTIAKHQLGEYVTITERLEISKAIDIAYTASAFLHLKYANRTAVDTSKHLDYLALQKAILLPVTDNGNLAYLIRRDQAGYVCESREECLSALEDLWLKHQKGESLRTPRSEGFLYSISREAEANKFVELIKKHCLE